MQDKICNTCGFFVSKYYSLGECRRHSPVLLRIHTEMSYMGEKGEFPHTSPNDFCGDWELACGTQAATREE